MAYTIVKITPSTIYLVDDDDGEPIQGMPEKVVQRIHEEYLSRRIIYLDKIGRAHV